MRQKGSNTKQSMRFPCAAPMRDRKRSPQREVDWRFSFSVSVSQRRRRGRNPFGDAGSSVG